MTDTQLVEAFLTIYSEWLLTVTTSKADIDQPQKDALSALLHRIMEPTGKAQGELDTTVQLVFATVGIKGELAEEKFRSTVDLYNAVLGELELPVLTTDQAAVLRGMFVHLAERMKQSEPLSRAITSDSQ